MCSTLVTDFRNYAVAEVTLGPGPNVFVGRNGQGKTNLAEAIAYLATLGSHRVSGDQAPMGDGADAAIIRARLAHGDRELLLEVQLNRQGANKARSTARRSRRASCRATRRSCCSHPKTCDRARRPGVRRRLLDQLLVQRTPRLAGCSPTTTACSSSATRC